MEENNIGKVQEEVVVTSVDNKKEGEPQDSSAILVGEDTMKELDANIIEETKMTINHPDFLKPGRLDGETDAQYGVRRRVQKLYIAQKKRGQQIWISKDLAFPIKDDQGNVIKYIETKGSTYNKAKLKKAFEDYKAAKEAAELKTETNK